MWVEEIKKYNMGDVKIFIVGNKSDLNDKRQVETEEGESLAQSLGFKFFETSAKENTKIDKAFENISNDVIEMMNKQPLKSNSDEMHISNQMFRQNEDKQCC